MGTHTILTINPGQNSTKIGVTKNDKVILDVNVQTPYDGSGGRLEQFFGHNPSLSSNSYFMVTSVSSFI